MNLALNLLGLLLTAALVENPFYTRCFMAETVDAQLNERRDVMLRSIIAAGMCLPAAISGWLGRLIFTGYTDIPVYLSTPAGILLYIVIFLAGCAMQPMRMASQYSRGWIPTGRMRNFTGLIPTGLRSTGTESHTKRESSLLHV